MPNIAWPIAERQDATSTGADAARPGAARPRKASLRRLMPPERAYLAACAMTFAGRTTAREIRFLFRAMTFHAFDTWRIDLCLHIARQNAGDAAEIRYQYRHDFNASFT